MRFPSTQDKRRAHMGNRGRVFWLILFLLIPTKVIDAMLRGWGALDGRLE